MRKILLIILIINCVHISTFSQDVIISAERWDQMRDERMVKSDSINLLLSQIESLRQDSVRLESQISNLKQLMTSYDPIVSSYNSLIQDTLRLSNYIVQQDEQIRLLREISDRSLARLANGRLQRKYNQAQVNESVLDLDSITTPEIKQRFSKVRELLILYPDVNEAFRLILISAQSDNRRLLSSGMEKYVENYIGLIKNMPYFKDYYLKRNQQNFWSIPYLNDMIESAIAILRKHNPGKDNYADFTTLIELL